MALRRSIVIDYDNQKTGFEDIDLHFRAHSIAVLALDLGSPGHVLHLSSHLEALHLHPLHLHPENP